MLDRTSTPCRLQGTLLLHVRDDRVLGALERALSAPDVRLVPHRCELEPGVELAAGEPGTPVDALLVQVDGSHDLRCLERLTLRHPEAPALVLVEDDGPWTIETLLSAGAAEVLPRSAVENGRRLERALRRLGARGRHLERLGRVHEREAMLWAAARSDLWAELDALRERRPTGGERLAYGI